MLGQKRPGPSSPTQTAPPGLVGRLGGVRTQLRGHRERHLLLGPEQLTPGCGLDVAPARAQTDRCGRMAQLHIKWRWRTIE